MSISAKPDCNKYKLSRKMFLPAHPYSPADGLPDGSGTGAKRRYSGQPEPLPGLAQKPKAHKFYKYNYFLYACGD
ncbi:MAG: hypothetical protein QM727_13295 [Niabella sp.]